jgi:hypothetical protein
MAPLVYLPELIEQIQASVNKLGFSAVVLPTAPLPIRRRAHLADL